MSNNVNSNTQEIIHKTSTITKLYDIVFNHIKKINFSNGVSPRTFKIFSGIVVLYSTLVISFSFGFIEINSLTILQGIGCAFVLFIFFYWLLTYLAFLFSESKGIKANEVKCKFDIKSFLISFAVLSIPYIISFLYWYPGIHNLDTLGQWDQVIYFNFDDWHPVFHTLIIWAISRISENHGFVVFIQNLLFVLALATLYTTLKRWGIHKYILVTIFFLISFSPIHHSFMQSLMKDGALTIVLIFITSITLDIYFQKSNLRLSKIIILGILLAMATMLRHNAFLLTIPYAVVLLTQFRKNRNLLYCVLVFFIGVALIRFPLYSLLDVTYPENTMVEATGVPMTILSDIYILNPDSLDNDTTKFLQSFAADDVWQSEYILGDFDSIKWASGVDYYVLNNKTFFEYVSMTLRAIYSNPILAFEAVRHVTSSVWNISGFYYFHFYFDRELIEEDIDFNIVEDYNDYIVQYSIGKSLRPLLHFPLLIMPNFILNNIGWCLLIILICFVVTYPVIGNSSRLLLLPMLVYCFASMLLLASPWQHRIFHFVLVITYPICIALFAKQNMNTK